MRLKFLTLQGFKSFPERVTIQFHKGVTAVVGPNGSGKSNICDAVRWVLGEQSNKALRIKSMEDIIFGGAQFKRPQSFAFVELSMDNTDRALPVDSDEVTVGRRLYRSGESEYLINQKAVRLRDVYELFMDTGLGRDGYSIIGQGRIAEIISEKSTERRDIFEEAAGISKYRYRREEAERQLASAEDNLVRIRDIEQELTQRVEPLREQSEKAKEFLRLSELRKRLDVSLSVSRYNAYQDTLRDLDAKLCLIQAQTAGLEESDRAAEAEIASCYEQIQQLLAQIEESRKTVHENETEIAGSSSEIAVFRNEIQHARDAIEKSASEQQQNERQRTGLAEKIERLHGEQDERRAGLDLLDRQIHEAESRIAETSGRLMTYMETQNRLSQELQNLANTIGEQNYALARAEARQNELSRRIDEGEERLEQRDFDRIACEDRIKAQQAEYEKLDAQTTALSERISDAQQRLFALQKNVEQETGALHQIEQKQNAVRQRIQILSELERNMEGYYGSVRQILRAGQTGRLTGIHGAVSELLTVDRAYTVAIETALGPAIQNLVVSAESDAKKCIAFLKSGNYGRATFLPLDTIRGEIVSLPELAQTPGFLGVAAELVRYDEKYRGVAASLLGRILIASDLDAASAISRATGRRFRVVTRDGQVVNAGGSYTGGSLAKSAGILSRRNEIDALRQESARLDQQASEQNALLEVARQDYENAEARLRPKQASLDENQKELVRQKVELQNRQRQHETILADMQKQRDELDMLRSTRQGDMGQHDRLKAAIAELEDRQLAVFEQIEKENAETGKLREENEARLHDKNTLSLKRVALEKDIERTAAELNEAEQFSRTLQKEYDALALARKQAEQSIADWEQKIQETAARADALTEVNRRHGDESQRLAGRRDELEQQANRRRAEQRERSGDRERLAAENARLTERQTAAQTEQEKLIARLWEEYELSKQQALQSAEPVDNAAAAAADLNRCRNQIKALGQVNVGAIEEYEQVRTRYEFMQAQIADIERSKQELGGVIEALEKNMKELFAAAFRQVADAFSELFSEFFGGGRAMLTLTDPDDLLNSGIDISVQPPGKIVKNLTSLSGGEQSFIAICLYFAILRVRPSPFCLLDEIESALDDVNVSKVGRYLRTMEHTQVIAITHRRGTMEQADVLYGVTTQQDGVSRVLTLDLSAAVAAVQK